VAACDHPSLCATALSVDAEAIDSKDANAKEDRDEADDLADLLGGLGVGGVRKCEVCTTPFVTLSITSCFHLARSTLMGSLSPTETKNCNECAEITKAAIVKGGGHDLPPSSAKIRMLLKLLQEVEDKSQGTQKTIVFSQFTSFLNLVEPFLHQKGIRFVRCMSGILSRKHMT
jgi:SNF2 family DNA or RNA helicase